MWLIRSAPLVRPSTLPIVFEMIIANRGGRLGGRTRKPGNILLNWRRLVRDTADLVLTGAGTIATPWLIPVAALSIFNKLWAHSKIELTREQAACLFAMWHQCDEDHKIQVDQALAECSNLFSVFKWPVLEQAQFKVILHDLESIRCIEMSESSTIWLCEWIRTSYK